MSKEASVEWNALTAEEKLAYKVPVIQELEESGTLSEFDPFFKWSKQTLALKEKHNIHVVAFCAHEHESRRVVDPLPIINSGMLKLKCKVYIWTKKVMGYLLEAARVLYGEISLVLPAPHDRLERLAVIDHRCKLE